MKRVLLVLLALAALAGGAFVAARRGWVRLPGIHPAPHASRAAPPPQPVSVDVPAITTNLGDADGSHFAQIALTVRLSGPAAAKTFDDRLPAVEDAVIADLRQRTSTQLGGTAGMTGLRQAITSSLDQVLGSGSAVQAVYFTQFIVQ